MMGYIQTHNGISGATANKTIQRDILYNTTGKSKCNSKKCSSNPQEVRKKKTERKKMERTNRKQQIKWQT